MQTSTKPSNGEKSTASPKPTSVSNMLTSWLGGSIEMLPSDWRNSAVMMPKYDALQFALSVQEWMERTGTSWAKLCEAACCASDALRKVIKNGRSITYRLQYKLAATILENWEGIPSGKTHGIARRPESVTSGTMHNLSEDTILARREETRLLREQHERYWLEQEAMKYQIPRHKIRALSEMAA